MLGAAVILSIAATAIGVMAWTELGPAPVTRSRAAAERRCTPATPVTTPTVGRRLLAVSVGLADQPTSVALYPDRPGDGVLSELPGRLRRIEAGRLTNDVVLDLTDDTTERGDAGLLATAYDPDGRWLYVYRVTKTLDDVITAHRVDEDGRPLPGDAVEVLHVDHPASGQHHGGSMAFRADGLLYLGLGDGGGLGDPRENAQNRASLLGKVLRIDPTPDAARPYAVPADNPFVDIHGWRPEIWALGVRNPFRMSIDEETGDIWLGDVGQTCSEELDRLPASAAGANLGWDRLEGHEQFEGGEVRGGHHAPVATYPHSAGFCAIVAGYVVRGDTIGDLDGWVLHTDYCRGRVLALDTRSTASTPPVRDLGVSVDSPIALLPGPAGLPWVLSRTGSVLELRPAASPAS